MGRAFQLVRVVPGVSAGVAPWLGLGALACALAWTVVQSRPEVSLALAVAGCGLAVWLLFPEVAVYLFVLLCPFELSYDIGPLRGVRLQDALMGLLAVSVATSLLAGSDRLARFGTPFAKAVLGIWMILIAWGTIVYLTGPANQWLLQDPVRNTWYLYRDVWRHLLPLPVIAYCLRDRQVGHRAVDLLLIVTTFIALYALVEAWRTGQNADGIFQGKNALAGYLVLVIPFATSRVFLGATWPRRLLYTVSLLILLRALWQTGSRGGLIAFLASLLPLALLVPRRRLAIAGAICLTALGLLSVRRADLLERPMVSRFLTLSRPAEIGNMQWRQEQWGLFMERIKLRPWLGTGSEVDTSLLGLDRAGSAHNVYLALALQGGVPMVLAWVVLLMVLGVTSLRLSDASFSSVEDRVFWTGMLGSVCALVTNNLAETNLLASQIQHLLWSLVAIAIVWRFEQEPSNQSPGARNE